MFNFQSFIRGYTIQDLSSVEFDFTFVSRFDGAVHNLSLGVNMEERELDNKVKHDDNDESPRSTLAEEGGTKVKPDEDNDSTQSTLLEEVVPPCQSAENELMKHDNFTKRLIKMDSDLSPKEAKKELAIANGVIIIALRNV
jgi:hypothetical protein